MGDKTFFRVRVSVLSTVLLVVLLWAWRDVRSRHGRNTWDRPLSVAVVLVRVGRLDDAAVAAFDDRVAALDTRLTDERRRYRGDALRPFVLSVLGPVDELQGAPKAQAESLAGAVKHAWQVWRWIAHVDRAAGVQPSEYDSRIYVAARAPADEDREMVEGESEEGGRLGIVEVDLDASMADFALFVVAHELFHTLGATDKYDETGRTLVPSGLAEPDRVPPLPQAFTEVMARNRPIQPGIEVPPTSLDELAVGPATAAEIGWTR